MMRTVAQIGIAGVVSLTLGCGGARLSGPVGEPVPDPSGFAESLRAASLPGTPQQITFGWDLNEQGSRVGGRGVVRSEAADRIRLDLFGPRGDTYLIAALVGEEYRLPPNAENAVALPSPSLLWASMGVLDPPRDATLTSATATENAAELRYSVPNGEIFVFSFQSSAGGEMRLIRLERASSRGVIETVTVDRGTDGALARASYRDWTAFRDLALNVESIRDEERFPADIWSPDAPAR
jgi:hypothetical protein